MRFADLNSCSSFFNMAMISHSCDVIEEHWNTLHEVKIPLTARHEDTVYVLTGVNGDIFIFTPTESGEGYGGYRLFEDAGVESESGVEELPDVIKDLLTESVVKGWTPKELLKLIGEYRSGYHEANSFCDRYEDEINHLKEMLQFLK